MPTIAEQLTALKNIQLGLRTAIEAKGVTVGAAPFIDYPAFVGSINDTGYAPPIWEGGGEAAAVYMAAGYVAAGYVSTTAPGLLTITEQLSLLKEIQRELRVAIEANGVPVGGAPFSDYPVLIGNIGTGIFDPAAIWGGASATWGGDPVSFGGS